MATATTTEPNRVDYDKISWRVTWMQPNSKFEEITPELLIQTIDQLVAAKNLPVIGVVVTVTAKGFISRLIWSQTLEEGKDKELIESLRSLDLSEGSYLAASTLHL
jgi:hypothetical protein